MHWTKDRADSGHMLLMSQKLTDLSTGPVSPGPATQASILKGTGGAKYTMTERADSGDILSVKGKVKVNGVNTVRNTPRHYGNSHDMGSRSVNCHPAEVTFPPLPQPKLVID